MGVAQIQMRDFPPGFFADNEKTHSTWWIAKATDWAKNALGSSRPWTERI